MKKLRDMQKGKCYRWEWSLFPKLLPEQHTQITLAEAQTFLANVYSALGIPEQTPNLKARGGKGGHYSWPSKASGPYGTIALSPPCLRKWIVLHEAAHALCMPHSTGANAIEPGHGPLYMAVYIELLRRFLGLKYSGLVVGARAGGLRVLDVAAMKKLIPALADAPVEVVPLKKAAIEKPAKSPAPKPSLSAAELAEKLKYHEAKRDRYTKRAAGHAAKVAEIKALLAPVVTIPPTGK